MSCRVNINLLKQTWILEQVDLTCMLDRAKMERQGVENNGNISAQDVISFLSKFGEKSKEMSGNIMMLQKFPHIVKY